eukprot:1147146-Pelagomonas_calceolata.AAC.4
MPCMHPSDLQRATGHVESADADAKRLNRVLQLTGLSDPVYAEAYVTCKGAEAYKCMLSSKVVYSNKPSKRTARLECKGTSYKKRVPWLWQVHQYDIVMDVTVINRTQETLQPLPWIAPPSFCKFNEQKLPHSPVP